MRVQKTNNLSFNGLNNPKLLKTLEFVGENNAIISSGVAFVAGGLIRPIATLMTPKTKKEDKEYIAAKSISSALVGFSLTNLFFNPISKSLKKIGENPEKYLKESTIKNLKSGGDSLKNSKAFNFLEQSIKMSSEMLSVIPKAILACTFIVPITKALFNKKDESKDLTFKGAVDKTISKIIDSDKIQKFAIKNQNSSINQHLMNSKDVLATLCFMTATGFNKKIKKEEKSPLIVNSALSTMITVGLGLGAKKIIDKPVDKFIDKFKKVNKDLPNLNKCINGIKVIEPILILGSIYYLLTPMISTYLTGKLTNKKVQNENK